MGSALIRELHIRDFAIIDEMAMELGPGLNVLTGETGAGKSIIVEAVHLLLGGRARTEVIRSGAEAATVEAIFEPSAEVAQRLKRFDLEADDGLLVRRVINRSGRSRVLVNGSPMTVALLQELADGLVDVTGQHEHHSLLQPQNHLEILDEAGGHAEARARVATCYEALRSLLDERQGLEANERERSVREDFLDFQVREIESARLREGEDEELGVERARLRSSEKLLAAAAGGEEALYAGDEAAAGVVARVESDLDDLGRLDPTLAELAGRLAAARLEIEDVGRSLGDYTRGLEADPARLEEIEERLALLSRMKRKYGGTLSDVIATGVRLAEELANFSTAAERLEALGPEISVAEHAFADACRRLSKGRKKTASSLQRGIETQLHGLAFDQSRFQVAVLPRTAGEHDLTVDGAAAGPRGIDRVEFVFAPNPGEEPRALARIASGGELSRVTLAIKSVLAATDPVGTYVFDEVDAGIGGAVGEVVGRKIRDVSRDRQVLCITHLPQIAALADRHFVVRKELSDGRTRCTVASLAEGARAGEVARMLGGLKITAKTRAHAEEMLRAAR